MTTCLGAARTRRGGEVGYDHAVGIRAWLSDWNQHRSPWGRARVEAQRVDEVMERISLEAADRAIARLTAQPPLLPAVGTDPDAYTVAFTRRFDGACVGDLRFVFDETDEETRIVAWWIDEEMEHRVRRGSLAVTEDDGTTIGASVAHVFLREALDVAQLEALAADPEGWTPTTTVPLSFAKDVAPPPEDVLALDTRWRGWAVMGSSVVVLGGIGVLALAVAALWWGEQRLSALLCWLPIGLFMVLGSGRRLAETVWLEPRARLLAIGSDGFLDPRSGRRVCWEDVTSVQRRVASVTWTLSDGRTFSVPRSWFMNPDAAVMKLSRRAGRRGKGPYRAPG